MVYIDRWKLHEAIMYLLKAFIGPLKEGKCSFDVSMFMQTVVLPGMASNGMRCIVLHLYDSYGFPVDHVLLVGRSLWAAGQLVSLLQQEVLLQWAATPTCYCRWSCDHSIDRWLQACSSGLNQSQSSIVRVCAAMAAYKWVYILYWYRDHPEWSP